MCSDGSGVLIIAEEIAEKFELCLWGGEKGVKGKAFGKNGFLFFYWRTSSGFDSEKEIRYIINNYHFASHGFLYYVNCKSYYKGI